MEEKKYNIIVRLDYETYRQWLFICSILKGTTRSDVFRRIIKRLYAPLFDTTKIKTYEV